MRHPFTRLALTAGRFLLASFGGLLVSPGFAQSPPAISAIHYDGSGPAVLQVEPPPGTYLVLYRGEGVTAIGTVADVGIWTGWSAPPTVELTDRIPPLGAGARFYRVEAIPVDQPRDLDSDGLDDVYELAYAPLLDPLDPRDAAADPDRDGRSNRDEYLARTNPLTADPPAPPASPVPESPPSATRSTFVEITGSAPTNSYVRVEGAAFVATNLVQPDGRFSVPVGLWTNRLNRLLVSAVGPGGVTSPGRPIEVLQDSQPPTLFADFPTNGMVLAASNTMIAGRVGDALSGYAGLRVWVHSSPSEGVPPLVTTRFPANSPFRATVDVGIGPNGTFERGGVPLAHGTNLITVLAEDALGNHTLRPIQVIRRDPVGTRLLAVAGDRQMAPVMGRLSEPLLVRVTEANGTPRPDTPLIFEITRSNGRLLPVSTNLLMADWRSDPSADTNGSLRLQLRTDHLGEARVWWTLGSDAGCANNRVCVTSPVIDHGTFFCASALPRPARQINIGSGNHQRVETGGLAPEPLRAWVSDGLNPAAAVPVTFRVIRGGGRLIPAGRDGIPAPHSLRAAVPGEEGVVEMVVTTGLTGHASVGLLAGRQPGPNLVEASFPGQLGLPATFLVHAVGRDPEVSGNFTGLILDNTSCPIGGAVCTLSTGNYTQSTTSDSEGRFRFEGVPGGMGHLHVNGRTANRLQGAALPTNSFPSLNYSIITVANAANALPTPVLLPRLNPDNAVVYRGTHDLVLTCAGIEGLRFTIQADSMTDEKGNAVTPENPVVVSLDPVHHDDVPMPMPDGVAPPFAWTFQPGGARFHPERPVKVEYPNMSGLAPGAVAYFLSFNHDTERFEIVASGSVTPDGSTIVTDPGSGITLAGWGCNCPPYSVTGDCDRGPDSDPNPEDGSDNGSGSPEGPGPDGPDGPPDQEPANDDDCPPGTPGCQDDCGDLTDPIHLFSGEMYLDIEDLRVRGRGFDFAWTRTYRSKIGFESPMGHGWDHSYNLFVEPHETNYFVCNGRGRKDQFRRRTDGTWSKTEFFQSLASNSDGTLTMTLADQFKWHFRPIDGTPSQGRISSMEDRNGNSMRFAYDGAGRLITITDTLDRLFRVEYNADGFISRVIDFAGRGLRYEYYAPGDSDGGRGDLKSATSPAVIGTPTGNDFPDGQTTTYTYSTGHLDERLNHNLLTITDGRRNHPGDPTFGQGPFVRNVYSTQTDPGHLLFDRVIRQIWGGGIIDLTYVPLPEPLPENNLAVLKVILNDRVGNVKELYYDRRNRLVIRREYTGRAKPDLPTTETENRPASPLRTDDPPWFETRQVWNSESLIRMVIRPRGDKTIYTYESDRNPEAPPRTRGNLRHVRRVPASAEPTVAALNDQSAIVEEFDYETEHSGGGCCGFNFVTRHRDGRGNMTTHRYDDRGNRIRTEHRVAGIVEDFEYNAFGQLTGHVLPDNGSGHRRRDELIYYSEGSQRGYLQRRIVDSNRLALVTSYQYDAVGNLVRETDPLGRDRQFVVNALDQVIRTLSPVVRAGSGIRHTNDFHFDANRNLVRTEVQNWTDVGAGPVLSAENPTWTTLYNYELLNHRTRTAREAEPGRFVVTEHEYDANRNLVLTRKGEATAGRQPDNVVRTLFDERDLPFRVIQGQGGGQPSTTQFDYDANGNRRAIWQGMEDDPHRSEFLHDGFNRLALEIDPMGNVTRRRFDSNGNLVNEVVIGELEDVPGNAANRRLAEHWLKYDAMDRLSREDRAHFHPETGIPIGDGAGSTFHTYAATSQPIETINDNGHATRLSYDTANRLARRTDAKGNSIRLHHDAAGHVIRQEDLERPDLAGPDELFVTTFGFDGLDRLVATTNSSGSVTRFGLDSRNNQTARIDALGNTVRDVYDGLDRLVRTERDLREGGTGSGAVVGRVVTRQTWDDSSRLTSQIDDNLNATTYHYDGLDRRFATVMADGTGLTNRLDPRGNVVETWDANGNHWTSQYDANERLVRREVRPGPGVADSTTFENYAYDGLSRLVRGENDQSLIRRAYDSQANLVHEEQNGRVARATFDGVGNLLTCQYPSGRIITNEYDALKRKRAIRDAEGLIAEWWFVGPSRVARRDYRNGTRTEWEYDGLAGVPNPPGDFGSRRIVRTHHFRVADGSTIDDRHYTWDRAGNKTGRRETRAGGTTQTFTYDSAYRLFRSTRTGGLLPDSTTTYLIDGAGNRIEVVSEGIITKYEMSDDVPEPKDRPVNQYSRIGDSHLVHDRNGNLLFRETSTGVESYRWDFRNRLVHYQAPANAAEYGYDVLGRRIRRRITGFDATEITYQFYHQQTIEELQSASGLVTETVYANYIDDAIERRTGPIVLTIHQDDQFSTIAITQTDGEILSFVEYKDFGTPHLFSPIRIPLHVGKDSLPVLYDGRHYDFEAGLYDFRTRFFDPASGRFLRRDPVGIWRDPSALGNGYTFAANSPYSFLDPFGTIALVTVNGSHVKIEIPIQYLGPGAATAAKGFNEAIQKTWSGKYGKYTVEVTVVPPRPGQAFNSVVVPAHGQDQFGKQKSASVSGGSKGWWPADSDPETIAHEAGHLMGLADRYDEHGPDEGWEDNIMGNMDGGIEERNIREIIDRFKEYGPKCRP